MSVDLESFYRFLAHEASDAIILRDAEGGIRFWNEAAHRIFGFTPQEALG